MTEDRPPDPFFDREMASRYDARNRGLAPISDSLHFLTRLVLADLPPRARILCVGVGTGAEILSLAEAREGWSFVGVDPSAEMLEVGRDRLARAGVLDRCELIRGDIRQAPEAEFDAVLSLLVAHFIPRGERPGFYGAIHDRLKPGGLYVTAEIAADLDAAEFPELLRTWEQVQTLMGATPDSLRRLPETLRETLHVLPAAETSRLMVAAGFALPVPFFQAFLIRGVFARK